MKEKLSVTLDPSLVKFLDRLPGASRSAKLERVLARDNPEVDDGWLCDRGRYGFEMLNGDARITGPDRGTCSLPSTLMRQQTRSTGVTTILITQ